MMLRYKELVDMYNHWFGRATGFVVFWLTSNTVPHLFTVFADNYPLSLRVSSAIRIAMDLLVYLPLVMLPAAGVTAEIDEVYLAANRTCQHVQDSEQNYAVRTFLERVSKLDISVRVMEVPVTYSLTGQLFYLSLTLVVYLVKVAAT